VGGCDPVYKYELNRIAEQRIIIRVRRGERSSARAEGTLTERRAEGAKHRKQRAERRQQRVEVQLKILESKDSEKRSSAGRAQS
jgi:hypothetical protein